MRTANSDGLGKAVLVPTERKIALIPRVWLRVGSDREQHLLLLTDRRTILIRLRRIRTEQTLVSGSYSIRSLFQLSAAIAGEGSLDHDSPIQSLDLSRAPPDFLAELKGSHSFPHEKLLKVRLSGSLRGPRIRLYYGRSGRLGFATSLSAETPERLIRERKAAGAPRRKTIQDWRRDVEKAFASALPPEVPLETRWAS